MSRIPAVVHVDVDGFTDIARGHGWTIDDGPDTIFESGLRALLELFAEADVTATFFTVANSLDDPRKADLLREAVRGGHEIASHTVSHQLLLDASVDEARTEIFESRDRLEQGLQTSVTGFRAPGYQIDRRGVELLEEAGYRWDSSVFPTDAFATRLEAPVEDLTRPGRPFSGLDLCEVPLPDHRPGPFPTTPSYALLLGHPYFSWGLRRAVSRARPFVLLYHLIDVADPLPASRLSGWKQKVFTLSNRSAETKRHRCRIMLNQVQAACDLTSTSALLDGTVGSGTPGSEPADG